MADTSNLTNFLNDIADAIRTKKETTSEISAADFDQEILSIETGIDTSDATAVADDIIAPKTAYVNGEKVTGSILSNYQNLDLQLQPVSLQTNRVTDCTPDGKYYAYLNGKNIYVCDAETNENLISINTELVSKNPSAIRFANGYIDIDKKIINLYMSACGHDGDLLYISCYRLQITDTTIQRYSDTDYTDVTYDTGDNSWAGSYTALFPHPTIHNIVVYTQGQRGYSPQYRLFQFGNTALVFNNLIGNIIYSCSEYPRSNIIWTSDTEFYTHVREGENFYKTTVGLSATNTVTGIQTIDLTSQYPTTYKAMSNLYYITSNKLYATSDKTLLADYSSQVGEYNLFITDYIFVSILNNELIEYKIEDDYSLTELDRKQTTLTSIYDTDSGQLHLFDKCRLTQYYNQAIGSMLVYKTDAKRLRYVTLKGINLYNTSDSIVSAGHILDKKSVYVNSGKIKGTMPNNGALNYTPTTSEQIIPSGYTSGGTIAAVDSSIDPNILASNIKSGVTILGVVGTYRGPNYEYTELEYIEGSGTQYIDTGVSGNEIGSYEIKFNPLTTTANSYEQYLAGTGNATPKLYHNGNSWMAGGYGVKVQTSSETIAAFPKEDVIHTIKIADGVILVDNVNKGTYTPGVWDQLSIYVFNSHSEPNLKSKMRLYSLKMYSGNVLVRDFMPCIKISTDEIGLFDKVNETFYTNAGTGTFIAGPTIG